MLKAILLVNGYPLSGKDAFAKAVSDVCLTRNVLVRKISTVDLVKEAWKVLGWDGKTKDEANRAALHEIKMIWTKYMDGSFKYVCREAQKLDDSCTDRVLLVDSREPAELMRFREAFGAEPSSNYLDFPNYNARSVIVRRQDHDIRFSNAADSHVEDFVYDFTVTNITGADWRAHLEGEAMRVLRTLI